MIKKAQSGIAVKAKPVMKKKKMQTPADFEPKSKFPVTPGGGDNYDATISREKELKKKGKLKNGGEVAAGVGSTPKRVGPVDPKGAYTKVQKRTLAKSKAGKPSLTKDKQQGATKMKKGGMRKSSGILF